VVDEKKMLFLSNIHRAMTTKKKKDYRKSQDQRYHVPTTTES
jgi:hypothetical protein